MFVAAQKMKKDNPSQFESYKAQAGKELEEENKSMGPLQIANKATRIAWAALGDDGQAPFKTTYTEAVRVWQERMRAEGHKFPRSRAGRGAEDSNDLHITNRSLFIREWKADNAAKIEELKASGESMNVYLNQLWRDTPAETKQTYAARATQIRKHAKSKTNAAGGSSVNAPSTTALSRPEAGAVRYAYKLRMEKKEAAEAATKKEKKEATETATKKKKERAVMKKAHHQRRRRSHSASSASSDASMSAEEEPLVSAATTPAAAAPEQSRVMEVIGLEEDEEGQKAGGASSPHSPSPPGSPSPSPRRSKKKTKKKKKKGSQATVSDEFSKTHNLAAEEEGDDSSESDVSFSSYSSYSSDSSSSRSPSPVPKRKKKGGKVPERKPKKKKTHSHKARSAQAPPPTKRARRM